MSEVAVVGKTEKVDLKSVKIPGSGHRSTLRTRIEALNVGEAVTVAHVERATIGAITQYLRREAGMFYTINKVGMFKYRVIRYK